MGAGSRIVTLRRGGGARRGRWSATSRTTRSRSSSRPCRSRPTGRLPGEPLRGRRHARPLRPRRRARRGARRRRRGDRRPARGRASRGVASTRGRRAGRCGASPSASATRRWCAIVPGAHRRGRRLPDRALAARGAADVGHPARRLPRAAARQPVAVPLPARPRRARAGRLLARAARRVRGRSREPLPHRRHDGARRRATSSGCSRRRRTAPST